MHDEIYIGELIRQKLEENGQKVSWLAKKIHSDRCNLYRILKRKSIDTQLLWNISIVLRFDFFSCYSEHFRQKTEKEQ
jgi:DNA invertase Pin-like site-specific DNA recombinase